MSGYIGNTPIPQATQTRDSFTATASQTSFATGGYTPNFLDVFLNGLKLNSSQFTATNGTDVVLTSAASANDIVEVIAYTAFEVADASFDDLALGGDLTVGGTVDGRDIAADGTKLDGIESGATGDQTNAEIRAAVEAATDSNVFTDADHTKLNAIEASATADQTASEIRTLVESATDSNVFTDADHTKLNAIESGATADQTKSDIEGLGIDVPATNLTGTIPAARLSTATTQAESDDSTKIATTAYVVDKITTLIGGAPSTLNDLNELAAAINDDANYNTTLTTALATKLPLAGGTLTGDLSFGDNDKAIFGAGSDLQIYHSGSASVIQDSGDGSLFLQGGSQIVLGNVGNSESYAVFNQDGAVQLRHNNAQKFTTTSTGIDVTGTVTADGLTVQTAQGNVTVQSTGSIMDFARDGASYIRATGASGNFQFITGAANFSNKRLTIGSNGDINFFEDTGTTAKLFWDASAESLGLGTSSPAQKLHVYGNSGTTALAVGDNGLVEPYGLLEADATNNVFSVHSRANYPITFKIANTERMRIDASGNVSIGSTSAHDSNAVLTLSKSGVASSVLKSTTNSVTFANVVNGTTSVAYSGTATNHPYYFMTNSTERMRIDSSGNLLVGTANSNPTSSAVNVAGQSFSTTGGVRSTVASNAAATFNRKTDDGGIVLFRKDGTTVGSIGTNTNGNFQLHGSATSHVGLQFGSPSILPINNSGASSDNAVDLGDSNVRFKDLYLSGNAYVGTSGFLSNRSGESIKLDNVDDAIEFNTANAERMRIDSSGNVLVGTTTASAGSNVGFRVALTGNVFSTVQGNYAGYFNRLGSDGEVIKILKDGSTVGSIGVASGAKMSIIGTNNNLQIGAAGSNVFNVSTASVYPDTDNSVDLGLSNRRFQDVYGVNFHGNGSNLTGVGGSTTAGAVGTYIWGYYTGGYSYFGSTYAGSSIYSTGTGTYPYSGQAYGDNRGGTQQSGTWRSMGNGSGAASRWGTTLFVRIS